MGKWRVVIHAAIVSALLLAAAVTARAQADALARRLDGAVKVAAVPITGVSIGDPANRSTWKVAPSSLQTAAQPTIDAFNPDDPAIPLAEADASADVYYRNKDVLAMAAVILEKTDAAFMTDTNATKRTKVVAAAVRFNQERKWVERNYAFFAFPANP